jgi:hypothetical protein
MINKSVIAITAYLVGGTAASYVIGKCPKIHLDWQASHPGEHLDTKRI